MGGGEGINLGETRAFGPLVPFLRDASTWATPGRDLLDHQEAAMVGEERDGLSATNEWVS